MTQKKLCRLCVNLCQDHKILYDEEGHGNEVYELMTKYFNETVLNTEEGNNLTAMCLECWSRIIDFHNFNLLVDQAQKNIFKKFQEIDMLVNTDKEYLTVDNCAYPTDRNLRINDQIIYIKSEDEGLSGSTSTNYPKSFFTISSVRVQEEIVKNELTSEEDLPIQIAGIEGSSKDEKKTTISLPKLELMDVFSGDDTSQGILLDTYDEPADVVIKNDISVGDCSMESHGSNNRNFNTKENSEGFIFNDTLTKNKVVKESDDLIALWKPSLECEMCSEECSTYSLLRQHFLDKHPLKKCYIICCQNKFYRRNTIESHIRHHIGRNAFVCKLCEKRYKTGCTLAAHMRKYHLKSTAGTGIDSTQTKIADKEMADLTAQWKSTFECALCRETCSTLKLLQLHFRQEHPQNQFYIECCLRKLKYRHDIEEHIRFHINPNAFKCQLCDTRHTNNLFLQSHMKSHHSKFNEGITKTTKKNIITDKDYNDLVTQWKPNLECVVCRKTCTTLPLLQQHFGQNHPHNELYIECCNRKLKRRDHILEHIRLHTDPNAFKCDLCTKCFRCRRHLLRHRNSHHPMGCVR